MGTKNKNSADSSIKGLGNFAISSLVVSTLLILCSIGFIAYLWLVSDENTIWKFIILRGWLIRSITLSSLVLRNAISVQSGICVSLIACLCMENSAVPFENIVAVSMMRGGDSTGVISTVKNLLYPMVRWSKKPANGRKWRFFAAGCVLIATATLSQLTSTVLLSDLRNTLVVGLNKTAPVAFGFKYDTKTGFTWSRSKSSIYQRPKPDAFPMFAEYTEPPYVADGVIDTGPSVRAFLPFDAVKRPLVRNYTGKALVLDSRVTCQKPELHNITFHKFNSKANDLTGTVVRTANTPGLHEYQTSKGNNSNLKPELKFWCRWTGENEVEFQFALVICSMITVNYRDTVGGLQSVFSGPDDEFSGQTFLLASTGYPDIQAYKESEIWKKATYELDISKKDSAHGAAFFTLCYAAMDVADRNIEAYSTSARVEPKVTWDGMSWGKSPHSPHDKNTTYLRKYDWDPLELQLDSRKNKSAEYRGIMNLRNREWSAPISNTIDTDGPVRRSDLDSNSVFKIVDDIRDSIGNRAVVFDPYLSGVESDAESAAQKVVPSYIVEDWLLSFMKQLMSNGPGEIAFAVQSLITVLAGISYYEQLMNYDKTTDATTVSFSETLAPGTKAHFPVGFVAVGALVAIQLITVILVVSLFVAGSRLSRVGDYWHAFAQVVTEDTVHFAAVAVESSDRKEVQRAIKVAGFKGQATGVSVDHKDTKSSLRRNGTTAEDLEQIPVPPPPPSYR